MDELIFDKILNEIIHEECVDINFAIRSGHFILEKVPKNIIILEKVTEVVTKKAKTAPRDLIKGNNNNFRPSQNNVYCPICNFAISGKRFAPHLEKCLRGGKRGSKNNTSTSSSSSSSASSSSSYSMSLPYFNTKPKKVYADPYPDSLVVKIKFRNGVPRSDAVREGVSLQDFLDSQLQQQSYQQQQQQQEEDGIVEVDDGEGMVQQLGKDLMSNENIQSSTSCNTTNNDGNDTTDTNNFNDYDGYRSTQIVHQSNGSTSSSSGNGAVTVFTVEDYNSKSPFTTTGLSASTSTRTSVCGDEDDNLTDIHSTMTNHHSHYFQENHNKINNQKEKYNGSGHIGHHNGKKRTKKKQTFVEDSFPS